MRIALLVLVVTCAGCHSAPQKARVMGGPGVIAPDQVLAGPYELRLSVSSTHAHPGERVLVGVELENSGFADLWAPPGHELVLGYQKEDSGVFSVRTTAGHSNCSGIDCVRLRPGEKVKYEQPFDVPNLEGEIEIYASVRSEISIPLIVERASGKKANQTPEPTPAAGRGSS